MHSSNSIKNKNSKSRVYSKVNTNRKHAKTLRKSKNQKNTKKIQYGGDYEGDIQEYYKSLVIDTPVYKSLLGDDLPDQVMVISNYDLIIMLIYLYVNNPNLTTKDVSNIFFYIAHLSNTDYNDHLLKSTEPYEKEIVKKLEKNVKSFLNLPDNQLLICKTSAVREPANFHKWLVMTSRSNVYNEDSKIPLFLLGKPQIDRLIKLTTDGGHIKSRSGIGRDHLQVPPIPERNLLRKKNSITNINLSNPVTNETSF